MTATVETISDQLDVSELPSENIAINRPLTSSDSDTVSNPTIGSNFEHSAYIKNQNFWQTSIGNFKFSLDELPQHLQLIFNLVHVSLNRDIFIQI